MRESLADRRARAAGFLGATARNIRHIGGNATVGQDVGIVVMRFATPSVFFHVTRAFAIRPAGGVWIGKSDLDAQHVGR